MSSGGSPSPSMVGSPSLSPHHHTSEDGKRVLSPSEREVSSGHPAPAGRNPSFPSREDCWSVEATQTLIDAWGFHHLELNRGNLRQKHWQAVADTVNARHGVTAKLKRTDVQCKNRIDTIKKKYKVEKAKVSQSRGRYISSWQHFESLNSLIGDQPKANGKNNAANGHSRILHRRDTSSSEKSSSPPSGPQRENSPISRHRGKVSATRHLQSWSVPVAPRTKRTGPGPGALTERNFSMMAAAAAAMEAEEDEYDEEEEEEDNPKAWRRHPLPLPSPPPAKGTKRKRPLQVGTLVEEGYLKLAEAIGKLAEVYEKVEASKHRQMVELEKQRIQFAKELELQRMRMFVESQVELEKLKRVKPKPNS